MGRKKPKGLRIIEALLPAPTPGSPNPLEDCFITHEEKLAGKRRPREADRGA